MLFERNLTETSNIIDAIEHNLKLKPNFKTLNSLMVDLNKNLLNYKYSIENKKDQDANFERTNLENLLIRIEQIDNIVKSKILLSKKYSDFMKF